MKHLIFAFFTLHFSLFILTAFAAVPLRWTVETSRATPAQFEAYQGETLAFEAALTSYGKPLEAPLNYSFFWQTNGMGNVYWSTNSIQTIEQSNNVLRATWTPSMETGARAYNCFIGVPGTIYHAAFQLRLRPSPGATPNALPLPQPVIDFAQVRVLNPPWGAGGVDTNAVIDIIHKTVDGAARPLPKYLHALDFDDSYPADAERYYVERASRPFGSCSSIRDGGFLYRNYDWKFDDAAEFVVKVSQGPSRFASVGVANVGTNLTEAFVTSGKPSRYYKCLPGHTVDGVNENGVACNINVVDGNPNWHPDLQTATPLHPFAAVRWILDNATNAQHAAEYIAANIRFPEGWSQNYHYMVCDETSTYIVENGTAYPIIGRPVMTNFRIAVEPNDGPGIERYNILMNPESSITNVWYTNAYRRETNPPWVSDLREVLAYTNEIFDAWAAHDKEYFRGKTNNGIPWWQTVHTSVYDLTNRTLRVAVQEVDDWYTFSVPGGTGVSPVQAREIAEDVASGKLDGPTVAPSTDESASGKAADANATGNALEDLNRGVSTAQSAADEALEVAGGAAYLASEAKELSEQNAGVIADLIDGKMDKAFPSEPVITHIAVLTLEGGVKDSGFTTDDITGKFDTSRVSSTDSTFTNAVIQTMKNITPPSLPHLRVWDDVRQCWWIGKMLNGTISWEVE